MASSTLDASALLAHFLDEPGKQAVAAALLAGAAISAVNLAEVLARLHQNGTHELALRQAVARLGLDVVPFDEDLAYRTAVLRPLTRHLGLSLGDRACLALAQKLGLPVLTADRAWADLSLGITIQLIR
ncbi:MAG: type II toxin-antitoxin system VapC family toxin [Dehalococcoidia bacterium]